MSAGRRVLFLDRDGVLVVEPPDTFQVDAFEKLRFVPGAITALARIARETDFRLVVVTNQDGLGTERFPEDAFHGPHRLMLDTFAGEGVVFDEVVVDRTHRHENAPTRKPGTGLLAHYLTGDFDLKNSFVVGDRPTDVQLAKNLGARAVLFGRSTDPQDDSDLTPLRDVIALETSDWAEAAAFLIGAGRRAEVHRTTNETDVRVSVALDGTGAVRAETGVGFFDHMLDQLGRHGGLDLDVTVTGDLHIDAHHTVEDTALALGAALAKAVGDKRGIARYGHALVPMDEARAEVALDLSGRPFLVWDAPALTPETMLGDFPAEMARHFFHSLADAARLTLHVRLSGENQHHLVEAAFKGVARALRMALATTGSGALPSTKGTL